MLSTYENIEDAIEDGKKAEQERDNYKAELDSYKQENEKMKKELENTTKELQETKTLNFTLSRKISAQSESFEDALLGMMDIK